MNSSKKQTRDTLAGTPSPSSLLDALKDLANLQNDAASFEFFAHRWPVLARVLDDDLPNDDVPPEQVPEFFEQHGYYPMKLGGFSYGEPPNRMPPNVPKKFLLMWQMREAVREIWRGNSDKATEVLLRSVSDMLGDPDPQGPYAQLGVNWKRGEFVYVPRSEFQAAVYQLLRRSALAKHCANPECPAPYFIAGRTTQQYCSEKCSGVLQRAHKLQWWNEHGPSWRRKRSRGKRGKR